MDLHSDDGLGFGHGDVDIDLDLRSTGGVDDDESLDDAGTDAGQDVQTVSGDQDDFMADNEDIIEEDVVDEDVELNLQPHSADHITALEQPLPQEDDAEEDLIDYSDEEDTAADGTPVAANAPQADNHDDSVIAEVGADTAAVDEASGPGDYAGEDETGSHLATVSHDGQNDLSLAQEQEPYTLQQHGTASTQQDDESKNENHNDFETSAQETQSQVRGASEPAVFSTATGVGESSFAQGGQDGEGSNFHPVNVNFNGKDYWLFQHHDYEGSGDYLLDDASFLEQPLHAVINACREALSALDVIVPSDLELGFRLDSLHHVELYEEHSTCAFFSLNDILRVYLQLYAHDGITDPEYFCITLLSRPRVSSLLAELSRAATEGIGYSGLDNVIASGQSLFSIHNSHSPTEHSSGEWEEGDVQEVSKAQAHLDGGKQDEYEEDHHEGHEGDNVQAPYDEEHGDEGWHHETNNEDQPERENAAEVSEEKETAAVSASDNADAENAIASTNEHVERSIVDTAASEQNVQDPQDDFIDYSDDEDSKGAPGNQIQTSRVSSASATVQGDEASQTQDYAEDVAQDEQQSKHDDEATHIGQAGFGADVFAKYEGNDYSYGGQASGGGYEEEYGQDYNEGQELESYPAYDDAQAMVEHTNPLGDLEQQPVDHADDLQIFVGSNVGEPDVVDDTFDGTNDFLEFDDTIAAPQQTVDNEAAEDEIDYSDEEDGAVSQAPVAASAAADSVVASSTGPQNLSPQGQKRTIDEVGNGAVDGITSIGMLPRRRPTL
ncbi:uncharacterized protein N0V89_000695 [Didymosphaeria variabile]|uniref:Uncharacterized protein n=1 Tax=Didymosphaeria variabile TaxID=1932322 RepID=A0A9W8XX39_9PLEO|nr:uncharacterized protein N0V89_000695 [Didymosphaeria variabile]KAJ4360135.1 hypothetical protein N0V89_000695 [Didymosphaeria variabile]